MGSNDGFSKSDVITLFATIIAITLVLFQDNYYAIFDTLFIILFLFKIGSVIINNKELFNEKSKSLAGIFLVIISLLDIFIVGYLVFFAFTIVFMPDKSLALLTALGFGTFYTFGKFKDNRIKIPKEAITISLNSLLGWLFGIIFLGLIYLNSKLGLILWLYALNFLISAYLFFIYILAIILFKNLFILWFNKKEKGHFGLIESWGKFKFKIAIYHFLFIFIVIFFILSFLFISPEPTPTIKTIDNCTIQYNYTFNDNDRLFNVYSLVLPYDKNYTEWDITLYGILKKDGEYEGISLLNDTDKSYIQYYDRPMVLGDDKLFKRLLIRFYNKRIYYIDKIEVSILKKIC